MSDHIADMNTMAPEGFRRDRFNQHWVCLETGAVCDAADVARILKIREMTEYARNNPEPARKVNKMLSLKEWSKENLLNEN